MAKKRRVLNSYSKNQKTFQQRVSRIVTAGPKLGPIQKNLADLVINVGFTSKKAVSGGMRLNNLEKDALATTAANVKRCRAILEENEVGIGIRKRIEGYVAFAIADNFRVRKDSKGREWAPLSKKTVDRRMKKGGQARTEAKEPVKQKRESKKKFQERVDLFKKKRDQRPYKYSRVAGKTEASERMRKQREFLSSEERAKKAPREIRDAVKARFDRNAQPLLDTGEYFNRLVGTKVGIGKTGAKLDVAQQAGSRGLRFRLEVRYKKGSSGFIKLVPKDLSAREKMIQRIHNRPTTSTLKAGKGSKIPGREHAYLTQRDQNRIQEILYMSLLAGGDLRKKTVDGEKVDRVRVTVGKKAFSKITKKDPNDNLLDQLYRMGYESSFADIFQQATLDFIDQAKNVRQSTMKRIREMNKI